MLIEVCRSVGGGALLLAGCGKNNFSVMVQLIMDTLFLALMLIIFFQASPPVGKGNENYKNATSIYDFTALDIDGNLVSLEKYR